MNILYSATERPKYNPLSQLLLVHWLSVKRDSPGSPGVGELRRSPCPSEVYEKVWYSVQCSLHALLLKAYYLLLITYYLKLKAASMSLVNVWKSEVLYTPPPDVWFIQMPLQFALLSKGFCFASFVILSCCFTREESLVKRDLYRNIYEVVKRLENYFLLFLLTYSRYFFCNTRIAANFNNNP